MRQIPHPPPHELFWGLNRTMGLSPLTPNKHVLQGRVLGQISLEAELSAQEWGKETVGGWWGEVTEGWSPSLTHSECLGSHPTESVSHWGKEDLSIVPSSVRPQDWQGLGRGRLPFGWGHFSREGDSWDWEQPTSQQLGDRCASRERGSEPGTSSFHYRQSHANIKDPGWRLAFTSRFGVCKSNIKLCIFL